jgi:hypothetical protein
MKLAMRKLLSGHCHELWAVRLILTIIAQGSQKREIAFARVGIAMIGVKASLIPLDIVGLIQKAKPEMHLTGDDTTN